MDPPVSSVSQEPLKLLLVEDSDSDVLLILFSLRDAGMQIERHLRVDTRKELIDTLTWDEWDVILVDFQLPGFGGEEALGMVQQYAPSTPALVVSGAVGEEQAVNTMRLGASDYILKDRLTGLAPAIRRTLEIAEAKRGEQRAYQEVEDLNKELRRTVEALTRSNQDLNDFAHIASHDLKEPLRAVEYLTQEMLHAFESRDRQEAETHATRIRAVVNRMRNLVNGLLAYAQADENSGEEWADTNQVVSGVLQDYQIALQQAQAEMRIGSLPAVALNATALRQIFSNLIGNSLKFRRPGIPLQISIQAVSSAQERVSFEVSDNGRGIDPAYHTKIFELFRRMHGPEIDGAGVGLALCKRLVERAGGRIQVSSTPHRGACFRFDLPLAQEGKSAAVGVAASATARYPS